MRHVLSALSVLVLILMCSCGGNTEAQIIQASEANMLDYMTRLYPTGKLSIHCMGTDSDNNGYVSCDGTVSFLDKPNELPAQVAAECSYRGKGCKAKK